MGYVDETGIVIAAILAIEGLLRLGEVIASRTQPAWDDKAVAHGWRILAAVKTLIGMATKR